MSAAKSRVRVEWYSISVDAVRYGMALAVVVVVLGIGFLGYQRWRTLQLERLAYEWVSKPESLIRQLRGEHERSYQGELAAAAEQLELARDALEEADHRGAIALGRASFAQLEAILERVRLGGSLAWFVGVQGDIEYRRGENGQFLTAYPRIELNEGDYVRSGAGASAEIHFRSEGTVFTLRPESLIKLSRERTGSNTTLGYMEYGWVALDTSQSPTSIATPFSVLEAERDSKASIELRPGGEESIVRVDQGRASVTNLSSGERRTLGERRQIAQLEDRFGSEVELPAQPLPLGPPDDWSINSDTTDEIVLTWQPVAQASRYALQVSRSRLFADTIIDDSERRTPRARLGIVEEGRYRWRVAAFDRRGNRGPWSDVREFRVASYRDLALDADTDPPVIQVEVRIHGNIALVQGRTEAGARLQLNDDEITVSADGAFVATHVLYGSGRLPLLFRATDRAGNVTTERRWVYLDES